MVASQQGDVKLLRQQLLGGPQPLPPPRVPGVSSVLSSPNSVGFWGHTLCACLCKGILTFKGSWGPPPSGWGALSVSFRPNWRGQVGTLVLLESSVLTLLAPGLLCPSPRLAPVDQAATSLVSRPDVCTLRSLFPSLHHHHQLGTTGCCLHPAYGQSHTKTADSLSPGTSSQHQTENMTRSATNFPSITHGRDSRPRHQQPHLINYGGGGSHGNTNAARETVPDNQPWMSNGQRMPPSPPSSK